MKESGIESESTSIDTSPIIEANSMDIYRVGTYIILLYSWERNKQCPEDRIGIRYLVVEESGIKSKSTQGVNSTNIHCIGTYLTLLCS